VVLRSILSELTAGSGAGPDRERADAAAEAETGLEAAQEAFEKRLGRAEAVALKRAAYFAASRLASS